MIKRFMFEIIVAKHKDGDVIADKKVAASSSEAAMAKMEIQKICADAGVTVDEVEYMILKLGEFREVQETMATEVNKF